MMRNLLLRGSRSEWLEGQFRKRQAARIAVSRFMPGEALGDAVRATHEMAPGGLSTVLTYLGENVTNPGEAAAVVDHYRAVIDTIEREDINTQVSVKLTQLGLDLGPDVAAANMETILEHTRRSQVFVWVDMEDSSYVDATIDVYLATRGKFKNVGLCLQSYLKRTERDLDRLLAADAVIRLVKGAYNEPPAIAFADKSQVDRNFLSLAETMLEEAGSVACHAFGTHDAAMISGVRRIAEGKALRPSCFEIHMLYGIKKAEQLRLAATGERVRILVSYGEKWFPWYMRRLAERPANLLFVARSLIGG